MRVHECHSHGVFSVQGALVGVAAIHRVHHVRHFLTRRPDGVFALFSQFPVGGREGHSQASHHEEHDQLQPACRPQPHKEDVSNVQVLNFCVDFFCFGRGCWLLTQDAEVRTDREEKGEEKRGREKKKIQEKRGEYEQGL